MSNKPIFLVTHPRSCSTAFERLFVNKPDEIVCIHEPFTEGPYHYGPERLGTRFRSDDQHRHEFGLGSNSTYAAVIQRIMREQKKGVRVFTKEMAYGIMPSDHKPASIAPSLLSISHQETMTLGGCGSNNSDLNSKNGYPHYPQVSESPNPTVLPKAILQEFHFTFLIRHPILSVPSLYRLTIPPQSTATGWLYFNPYEASYKPLRRLFDYLLQEKQIGPTVAGKNWHNSSHLADNEGVVEICVVDANDLLDQPAAVLKAYCKSTGVSYDDSMLSWNSRSNQERASATFEKFKGFHKDVLNSTSLKPRVQGQETTSLEDLMKEWTEEFGETAANVISLTVKNNLADYEYLKQYALKL